MQAPPPFADVAKSIMRLVDVASDAQMNEQTEAQLRTLGISTHTFDLAELPSRVHSPFLSVVSLLTEANHDQVQAGDLQETITHIRVAFLVALAISHAYEGQTWREEQL